MQSIPVKFTTAKTCQHRPRFIERNGVYDGFPSKAEPFPEHSATTALHGADALNCKLILADNTRSIKPGVGRLLPPHLRPT